MLPKSIIFDWDNTLVDTWEVTRDIVNHVRVKFDQPAWSIEEIKNNTHFSAKDAFPKWFGDKTEEAFLCLKQYIEEGQEDQIKSLSAIDGAHDLLIYLSKKNIPCSIYSNKQGERLRTEVNYMNWNPYFVGVYGSQDFPFDKPNAYGALEIIKKYSWEADSTWFIGDTTVDWTCAKNSGCLPIRVGNTNIEDDILSFNNCIDILNYMNKQIQTLT